MNGYHGLLPYESATRRIQEVYEGQLTRAGFVRVVPG